MKIMPVQKQTRAGQRTRFKAFVVVGDNDGHIGVGVKCSKEVATAIRGAISAAKLAVVPIRRGYWGNNIGRPHTVPCKVNGKCGSVRIRIVPAPRGTALVAAPVPKKILTYAGIEDVYTNSRGKTKTMGNFAKATFFAIAKTYLYLTPDLWAKYKLNKSPFHEHSVFLADTDDFETKPGSTAPHLRGQAARRRPHPLGLQHPEGVHPSFGAPPARWHANLRQDHHGKDHHPRGRSVRHHREREGQDPG